MLFTFKKKTGRGARMADRKGKKNLVRERQARQETPVTKLSIRAERTGLSHLGGRPSLRVQGCACHHGGENPIARGGATG